MGEVANAQLHSPEIVIGYIMVFDRFFDRLVDHVKFRNPEALG